MLKWLVLFVSYKIINKLPCWFHPLKTRYNPNQKVHDEYLKIFLQNWIQLCSSDFLLFLSLWDLTKKSFYNRRLSMRVFNCWKQCYVCRCWFLLHSYPPWKKILCPRERKQWQDGEILEWVFIGYNWDWTQ